jgi:hypothetical protein
MTDPELRAAINEAARAGAKEALRDIGLHDDEAGRDIRDLRDLIDGWRSVKATVGQTIARFVTMAILGAIAAGSFFTMRE